MRRPFQCPRVEPAEGLPIRLRDRQHKIEARQRVALEPKHAPPLLREQEPAGRIRGVFGMPPPDLRLDVVCEQDCRARQASWQIHDRWQEVADQRVEPALGRASDCDP